MGAAAPRLRDDLIVRQQESSDAPSFVIKDPRTGAFYRWREAEHFIAGQLDGVTPLGEIRERTEQHFDASLPDDALESFIAKLRGSGLLERPGKPPRTKKRKWIRGTLLYLRVPLFDPDAVLDRLAASTRPLFTPPAFLAAIFACLLAAWITVGQTAAIRLHLSGVGGRQLFFIAFGLMILSVSIHELAHGLACKHFGGAVHEMGFMLVYFQPAFYCNVSDAWLLPEKAKRLWVSFAGIAIELSLWALGTIIWRVTEPDTWPNFFALALLTTSGIKTLLNLNPFIKLDGYYILSDWLDIPNLRRKAFRFVGDQARALFGHPVAIPMVTTPRERRIFAAYGTIALTASISLIAYVVIQMGSYLVEMHRPSALAVLVGAVGLKVRRRVRRLFGGRNGAGDAGDDEPPPLTESEPDPEAPLRIAPPTATGPAEPYLTRRRLWALAGVGALLILCFGRMRLTIGGPFALLPDRSGEVRTEVEGIVAEVLVNEGDAVAAGQPIARLVDRDFSVTQRKTAAALAEARANLRKLERGPTAAEIAVARAGAERAVDRLRFATATAQRVASLVALNGATRQEAESAQQVATTATNDVAEAQGRLHILEAGSRPEDIAAMRAQVAQLAAQADYDLDQLRRVTIVSPVAGVVATPARELRAMTGQLVAKGALIARVFAYDTVIAQIVIPEQEIADVRVGLPVVLRARAYPDRAFTGRVTAIATVATGAAAGADPVSVAGTTPIQSLPIRSFLVTTAIQNDGQLLRPGMTGHVKVVGEKHRIIGLIGRRLSRVLRVEVWSWW